MGHATWGMQHSHDYLITIGMPGEEQQDPGISQGATSRLDKRYCSRSRGCTHTVHPEEENIV